MIEVGTVKKLLADGKVLVAFEHLELEVACDVLQPSTGTNTIFCLPSVGTQVVCSLEAGRNFALGAVFSQEEKVPDEADPEGLHIDAGGIVLDFARGKAGLKNDTTDVKTILKDLLSAIQNLTVSTPMGPSGTPLPPTVSAIESLTKKVEELFK